MLGTYANNGNPKAATFVGTDISKWITTSATTLYETFYKAGEMNADLTGWNVAKVATLQQTFRSASKFAGTGLSSWITTSVTTLKGTFYDAGEMNADLSGWKVGKVVTMIDMFVRASKFAGAGLSSWITTSITSLHNTFWSAGEMNADLSAWKVGKVTTLYATFSNAGKYAGVGLDSWDVSEVNKMDNAFTSTTSLTSCSKRTIADAWKSNSAFDSYKTSWAADACPVRTSGL